MYIDQYCWIMLQHIVYSLSNRQGLLEQATTKFMVVVTSLFNPVISSFPDNMFYHAWTTLLIYHNGSNNVVQVCLFIKPWTVRSNMHGQACQQPCSSWPAQPCSRLSTGKNKLQYAFYVCILNAIRYLVYTWYSIVSYRIGIVSYGNDNEL